VPTQAIIGDMVAGNRVGKGNVSSLSGLTKGVQALDAKALVITQMNLDVGS